MWQTMANPVLRKLGGSYQLVVEGPEQLAQMAQLDEARWTASSAPTSSLNVDPRFLACVDRDDNGRIRPEELKAACHWILSVLRDHSDIGSTTLKLQLGHVNTDHPDGSRVLASAHRILGNLGVQDADSITLDQVRNLQHIRASAATNGDGIIPPEAVEDASLKQFIEDIIATTGSALDLGGKRGVTAIELAAFLKSAQARIAWEERSDHGLGPDAAKAWSAIASLRAPMETWFRTCDLVCLDPELAKKRFDANFDATMKLQGAGPVTDYLDHLPLAPPNAKGQLHMDGWLHPSHREALAHVRERVPMGGAPPHVDEQAWRALLTRFAPYQAWLEEEAGKDVAPIGSERLATYTNDPVYKDALTALIATDKAVAVELAEIATVERVILYQRWLLDLTNNFVSFAQFYDPTRRSMVEWGTLVMDGRRFDLALRIANRKAHKECAKKSMICLLYVEATGRSSDDVLTLAVAVTSRDRGSLYLGKRGVFYTTDGRDWDAVVVDVLDNPISLWEAAKRPIVGLVDLVTAQLERFSEARQTQLETQVQSTLSKTETAAQELQKTTQTEGVAVPAAEASAPEPAAAPPAADQSGALQNLMMSGSVAVAALSSAFAYLMSTLSTIDLTQVLAITGGLAALVLVPPTLLAAVRLRQRDLGRVLEAGGWAINSRLRLPSWAGAVFTRTPPLPPGSVKSSGELLVQYRSRAMDEVVQRSRTVGWALLFAAAVATAAAVWMLG
jgi:hypothetical protein